MRTARPLRSPPVATTILNTWLPVAAKSSSTALGGLVAWAALTALAAWVLPATPALAADPAHAAPVLMISVDGMKPEYVTEAGRHGLKVPLLRSLMAEGAYADGVEGVWPTITYPSHTTLLTGVSPAEHGIYGNLEFDPRHTYGDAWFWYAHEIRVPTLWQAAHQAGLTTASIGWPVSVGATDVDFLIPEYWRIFRPTQELNPADRELIADLSRPEGMLRAMQSSLGPYLMGNDTSSAADETKTRFALDLLAAHRPRFMTLHLSSLDETEHAHGPFSAEANEAMEAIDRMLARLVAASRAIDPAAVTVVVSDHGFEEVHHQLHLYIPFIQAGLIEARIDAANAPATLPVKTLAGTGFSAAVSGWTAVPWLAGGMAAVVQSDPSDEAARLRVLDLLHGLAANPDSGVGAILERAEISRRGAFPNASFLIVMKPGYYLGTNSTGPMVTEFHGHGGHGFAPTDTAMRSALFVAGQGIARHRDLGVIDMRQIAPTVAGLLGVPMPSATAKPLAVRQ